MREFQEKCVNYSKNLRTDNQVLQTQVVVKKNTPQRLNLGLN